MVKSLKFYVYRKCWRTHGSAIHLRLKFLSWKWLNIKRKLELMSKHPNKVLSMLLTQLNTINSLVQLIPTITGCANPYSQSDWNGRQMSSICWCSCIKRNPLRQWRRNWNQGCWNRSSTCSVYDWRYRHHWTYGNHWRWNGSPCLQSGWTWRQTMHLNAFQKKLQPHFAEDGKGYRTDWVALLVNVPDCDYQYTGRSTHEEGIHTHYYKLIGTWSAKWCTSGWFQLWMLPVTLMKVVAKSRMLKRVWFPHLLWLVTPMTTGHRNHRRRYCSNSCLQSRWTWSAKWCTSSMRSKIVGNSLCEWGWWRNQIRDWGICGWVLPQIDNYEFTGVTKLNDGKDVQTHNTVCRYMKCQTKRQLLVLSCK